jgi:putative transposase
LDATKPISLRMAGTYTQIHIHFVFAVDGRANLVLPHFREELERYITGIVQERNHKLLAIFCMPDHTHVFVGKRPNQSESDLMRDIKSNSSKFIHEKRWVKGRFAWQEGYGAFSHAKSQVKEVIAYILNQPQHHQKKSFQEEYREMLKRLEVEYDERYLFKWIEDE